MTNENRELMTPAEAANAFRVTPKTVTRWAQAGKLTSIRTMGGHRRYDAVEVRALLNGEPLPGVEYPDAVREVDGLAGHTVTVERLETGRLAAVERSGGTFMSTRHVAGDGELPRITEQIAELAAGVIGAQYVAVAR